MSIDSRLLIWPFTDKIEFFYLGFIGFLEYIFGTQVEQTMADIVQKSTEYRIKQIEIAEAKYYKTLIA